MKNFRYEISYIKNLSKNNYKEYVVDILYWVNNFVDKNSFDFNILSEITFLDLSVLEDVFNRLNYYKRSNLNTISYTVIRRLNLLLKMYKTSLKFRFKISCYSIMKRLNKRFKKNV